MFTVFGGTGNTGSVVAETLLKQGKKVRILARHADKAARLKSLGAEIATGDVTDSKSVSEALKGAEGAYLLLPPDLASNDLLAKNAGILRNYVEGLKANPVRHAVLLSSVGAQEPIGTGPIVGSHRAEQALAGLNGTAFTFLRAAYFMENILNNAYPMKQDGVLPVFGGGETFAFPMVATRDIGRVAAEALISPPATTQVIELSGPREYSFTDAAQIASRIFNRKVTATPAPLEAMASTLTRFGFSANVAGLFREMTEGFGKGLVKFEGKGRAVRGRVTLDEVLEALRG